MKALLLCLTCLATALSSHAQTDSTNAPSKPDLQPPSDWLERLCDAGTNRSQVVPTFRYLTDVIGGRLTGSPACRRANDWTRATLADWGFTNAHLEAWGPFGRGWSVKRFSAQVVAPQCIPLVAWPKAWSCGAEGPFIADVVLLDIQNEADYEKYRGQLKGTVVLVSQPRDIAVSFDPVATRLNETNLLRLANAAARTPRVRPGAPGGPRRPGPGNQSPAQRPGRDSAFQPSPSGTPPPTNNALIASITNRPPRRPFGGGGGFNERLRFAVREGALATISVSPSGTGGALSVGSALVVAPPGQDTNRADAFPFSPWATNAPAGPPQIVVAAEQYNRLVQMIRSGERLKIALDVQTEFHSADPMCYNTVADFPGTDLKKEIVMVGAHLDSMAGGTGATDNAAGVAVCMEAMRLLKAANLQPRRTVRIGLWSGEEQGLNGSRAYVETHLGYMTNAPAPEAVRSPKDQTLDLTGRPERRTEGRRLVEHKEYDRFSAYYNLDNGAGRIRGIYLQGNEALRSVFRPWLQALRDLGAETITASDTGGTDHQSFDRIGLPGFQFLQDPVEYWRSYHTTIDVRERAPVEDLQQAAIVMAAFVYQTAMRDELLPRKQFDANASGPRF